MNATICKNSVPVVHSVRKDVGREYLTVTCPAGWEDVQPLTGKVLVYDGRKFIFTGWDSDKNEAYFVAPIGGNASTATIQ